MGRLLKAVCSNCDYESGLLRAEAGRYSGTTYFGAPALCFSEKAVVTVNIRAHKESALDTMHDTLANESGPDTGPAKAQALTESSAEHSSDKGVAHGSHTVSKDQRPSPASPIISGPAQHDHPGHNSKTHAAQHKNPTHKPEAPHQDHDHAHTVAADHRSTSHLVATPVPPRMTIPTPSDPDRISPAEQQSLEFTGASASHKPAPVSSDIAVPAYPCPNDGSATILYDVKAEDLETGQECPKCSEHTLSFSVEGRWD